MFAFSTLDCLGHGFFFSGLAPRLRTRNARERKKKKAPKKERKVKCCKNNHHKIAPTSVHMVLAGVERRRKTTIEHRQNKIIKTPNPLVERAALKHSKRARREKRTRKEKYFVEATHWRQQAKVSGNGVQVLALARGDPLQ